MEDCLFCKIVRGEIPSQKVYEDDDILAFRDISPQAPVHILLIPKKHLANILEMSPEDHFLLGRIQQIIARLAQEEGIAEAGFRLINNCGVQGGQTVDHLHFHLLGGRNLGWPPG